MYWLLCAIGGCQTPVDWQKSGASVVIADYVSVSFEGGGWFDTIVNLEIADGETYGDAVLSALRAAGSIYSEQTEGISQDETLQYVIYGDPNLRLIFDDDDVVINMEQSGSQQQSSQPSGQPGSNE
jgi:hypothetical protein